MNSEFYSDFKQCWEKIEGVGLLYAEARGQSYQSQELKGSILASLIKNYPNLPVSKAEIEAKDSPEYRKHIEETAEKITKELCLKAKYERWKAQFEATRSLSSLEKVTQNQIG